MLLATAIALVTALMPMKASAQTTLKNFSNWIWIWKIQTEVEKYGSIDAVIAQLKQLGIHNVCMKFHEGASPIGGGVDYRAAYYQYKDAFKKAGFTVGTWGYNYFNDLPAEEGLIDEAIKNSDYYIFDPEADTSGKFSQAKTILTNLRKKHPKFLIGYSTFPIASFHKDIDYKDFDKYCDFASPQIYWGELTWGAVEAITRMLKDHKAIAVTKPIYPSIQTYNVSSSSYKKFLTYKFAKYGAWSLDDADDVYAQFVSKNPKAVISAAYLPSSVRLMRVQHVLNGVMGTQLEENDTLDEPTQEVIKQFQAIMGLPQTGQLTLKTWQALALVNEKHIIGAEDSEHPYPTRYIQWRMGLPITGVYDDAMKAAITAYQTAGGITATGVVGQATWTALWPPQPLAETPVK